jgi:hypothetical protein
VAAFLKMVQLAADHGNGLQPCRGRITHVSG